VGVYFDYLMAMEIGKGKEALIGNLLMRIMENKRKGR